MYSFFINSKIFNHRYVKYTHVHWNEKKLKTVLSNRTSSIFPAILSRLNYTRIRADNPRRKYIFSNMFSYLRRACWA